jgi:hypothetical protein
MPVTFGDTWRLVRLHVPDAPFGLVRDWTQRAYEQLVNRRPWVWTMVETRLSTLAARAITVTATQGSTTITSAAAFVATDAGRQFRVGTYPIYTINSVESTSSATLDQPYAATGGSLVGQIISAYQTMPEDFGAFLLVIDPTVRRQIAWWYTQEDLARVDPTRIVSSSDLQRALVATSLSTAPATLGQLRYEWWPYPTTARQFPAWYRSRPKALADTDVFQGVLATGAKVLEKGALALASKWPGTTDRKNPYFNLGLAKLLTDEFDHECALLELRDDDQAQQSWVALPYHRWPAWGLYGDTTTLRASDATVADYYGASEYYR